MPPPHQASQTSVAVTAFVALVSAFALGAVSGSLLSGGGGQVNNADHDDNKNASCTCNNRENNKPTSDTKASERETNDDDNDGTSLNMVPIGKISSVYRLCVGTPRQGLLAPNSRGRIELSPSILSSDSILGLDGFSHLWVVFVFHLNTNTKIVKESAAAAAAATAGKQKKGGKGGGSRQFPSKIAPPALGGQKVGLFSTRTPHRPNPIGLTLCKIDSISRGNDKDPSQPFYVNVSGLDLVDGTPVLDIKPFVPHYDTVISLDDYNGEEDSGTSGSNCIRKGVTLPHWVGSGLAKRRNVAFTSDALQQLEDIVQTNPPALKFYGPQSGRDGTVEDGLNAVQRCIREVLAIDVRSKWQTKKARKGKFQAERAERVKNVMGDGEVASADPGTTGAEKDDKEEQQLCTQQLDNLLIKYSVSAPSDGKEEDDAAMGSGANDNVVVRAIELLRSSCSEMKAKGSHEDIEAASTNDVKEISDISDGKPTDTTEDGAEMTEETTPKMRDSDLIYGEGKQGSEGGKEDSSNVDPPKEFGKLKSYWSEKAQQTPSGITPLTSVERLDPNKQASGKVLAFGNRRVLTPQKNEVSKFNPADTAKSKDADAAALAATISARGEVDDSVVKDTSDSVPPEKEPNAKPPGTKEDIDVKGGPEIQDAVDSTAPDIKKDNAQSNGGDKSKTQTAVPSHASKAVGSNPNKKRRNRKKKKKAGPSTTSN